MKIEKIEIQNIRCFQNYTMEFAPGITVLIGNSGSGKNSLMKSIVNALSFIFSIKNGLEREKIQLTKNLRLNIKNIRYDDIWWDKDHITAKYANIKVAANFQGKMLSWEILKISATRTKPDERYYQEAFDKFIAQAIRIKKVPLLAYYSSSFPKRTSKTNRYINTFFNNGYITSRDLGYYQWGEEKIHLKLWHIKYMNCYKNWLESKKREKLVASGLKRMNESGYYYVKDMKKLERHLVFLHKKTEYYQKEWKYILDALKRFSNNSIGLTPSKFVVKNLLPKQKEEGDHLAFKMDDRTVLFDHLPNEYKRLYGIVIDIASRSFALNGCEPPSGIVMIDKLEKYLSPSLEKSVLQRLTKTFPDIQFIVSTNSPTIISKLRRYEVTKGQPTNQAYWMEPGQNKPVILSDKDCEEMKLYEFLQ